MIKKIEWKIAFKTALSVIITLFASLAIDTYFHRPDSIISGLWAAAASIVVQQGHLGLTYKSAWNRFLGILVGSLMGGFFTTFIGSNPFSVGASIFLTIVICSLLNLKDSLRIACLSVAIIMVLWGIRPHINPWVFAWYRFTDSCLGIFVAITVAHLIWPLQASKKLALLASQSLFNIRGIYAQTATPETITEDQQINIKKSIRKTYDLIWKARQLLEDSKLELLTAYSSLDEWKFFFNHLENLLDRLDVISKSYRQNLPHLLDASLADCLKELVKITDSTLEEMFHAIEKLQPAPGDLALRNSLESLNQEILRFRKTKRTQQFTLDDVEGYYVFFYSIRSFAEEISKAQGHMQKISAEANS